MLGLPDKPRLVGCWLVVVVGVGWLLWLLVCCVLGWLGICFGDGLLSVFAMCWVLTFGGGGA